MRSKFFAVLGTAVVAAALLTGCTSNGADLGVDPFLVPTSVPVATQAPVPVVIVPAPAPVAVAPVAQVAGPAMMAPAPAPAVAVANVPNTVSVIPDNTVVAAGTLVVVRTADFGKKMVNVSAGNLPQQTIFGVNGDVHTDGWWGYGNPSGATEGACKELNELRSHVSRQGDTWYQFAINTNVNCGTSSSVATPSAPAAVVVTTNTTSSGGIVMITPVAGLRVPYTGPSASQPDPIQGQRVFIGKNIWRGVQLDLAPLKTLETMQWYLAHGDVNGNGSCAVKVWKTGRPAVNELSRATWQLYTLVGPNDAALNDSVAVEQEIAGGVDNCPVQFVR